MGFSIVGMTALPEAKLAREAEICYTTVGLVTDYDVWKEGEEVSVETVVESLEANVVNSKKLVKFVLPRLSGRERNCACTNALRYAIMTKDYQKTKQYQKLKLLLEKYK
jgi:5'-methylthioadenosine phosphorylase